MKKLSCFCLIILLAACTFPARDTGTSFMFALQPVKTAQQSVEKGSLVVFAPTTSPELDTFRIALNKDGRRWDYYAGARWADFMPVLVQDNLTKTLEQTGLFKTVTTGDSGLTGDKILKTEIRTFQAEYGAGSEVPVIKIRMVINLVSRLERRPVSSFVIAAEKKATGNNLSAIQAAFAGAFDDTQQQIVKKLAEMAQ